MKVLLIEDDPEMLEQLAAAFRGRWPSSTILSSATGDQGLTLLREHGPDLVVTDLSTSGTDGFEVVREIRRSAVDMPLVVLTGRADDVDQQRGFVLGADDYIVKPFSVATLLARINALLRRSGRSEGVLQAETLTAGDLYIDMVNRQVRLGDNDVALTPLEYSLLYHLARDAGDLISHAELLERIWGSSWGATLNDLKSLVGRLRAKIGDSAQQPVYIITVRGLGYRFNRPERIMARVARDSSR